MLRLQLSTPMGARGCAHRRSRTSLRASSGSNRPTPPREIIDLLREHPSDPANVWATKPPWCQPWTIVATGSAIVAFPTQIAHLPWYCSALVSVPIAAWWLLFLGFMPRQFAEDVANARALYGDNRKP